MTLDYDPRYLEGIVQFNRGEYFESHELWEALWRATPGPPRQFYKGLIQAAVSLYHAGRGNPRGAGRLLGRSCRLLEAYRPCYLGLDVDRFLMELGQSVRDRLRSAEPPSPGRPQIELCPPQNGPRDTAGRPILEKPFGPPAEA